MDGQSAHVTRASRRSRALTRSHTLGRTPTDLSSDSQIDADRRRCPLGRAIGTTQPRRQTRNGDSLPMRSRSCACPLEHGGASMELSTLGRWRDRVTRLTSSTTPPIPARYGRRRALAPVGPRSEHADSPVVSRQLGGSRRGSRSSASWLRSSYFPAAWSASKMRFQLRRDTALGIATNACVRRRLFPKSC